MPEHDTEPSALEFASLPDEVGRQVRIARQSVELTQHELGQKVGLSRVSINQIENGKRKQLKVKVLKDIAFVTNRPLNFFLPHSTNLEIMGNPAPPPSP